MEFSIIRVGKDDEDERSDDFDDVESGAADESQIAAGFAVPLQGSLPECTADEIRAAALVRQYQSTRYRGGHIRGTVQAGIAALPDPHADERGFRHQVSRGAVVGGAADDNAIKGNNESARRELT